MMSKYLTSRCQNFALPVVQNFDTNTIQRNSNQRTKIQLKYKSFLGNQKAIVWLYPSNFGGLYKRSILLLKSRTKTATPRKPPGVPPFCLHGVFLDSSDVESSNRARRYAPPHGGRVQQTDFPLAAQACLRVGKQTVWPDPHSSGHRVGFDRVADVPRLPTLRPGLRPLQSGVGRPGYPQRGYSLRSSALRRHARLETAFGRL